MFCPQCGATNEDTDRFCSSCGQDLSARRAPAQSGGYQQGYSQPYQQYQAPYQQSYQQGYQPGPRYGAVPHVPSYMGWAIAVLLLCFWPTGIAAVVNASRVGNQLAMGDVSGAQESSRKAKMWCWITFGIGVAAWIIGMLLWYFYYRTVLDIYNPYDYF